jgi:SAM-dependent methyltransferase
MNVARAELLQVPSSKVVSFPASPPNVQGVGHGATTHRRSLDEIAKLEALLRDVTDVTALSAELIERAIKDNLWYHVTPFRSALARALDLPLSARILEVGCGGGALTRYLGERGFQVVALETSEALAECARLRCKDLSNVEVVTGFLEHVIDDQKFDFVLCIDPVFVESEFFDPGLQLLTLSRRVLKATGSLILSVGNPLHSPGGSHIEPSQDHVRGKGAPLEAIKQSLGGAGFVHFENYLTFPHHAAPRVIVDPQQARVDRASWLGLLNDLYSASDLARGELESWWRGIYNEGLEGPLAPGWLIVAHAHHVHSVVWGGQPVKQFVVTASDGAPGESQNGHGIGVHELTIAKQELLSAIQDASKPALNSVRDYKASLVSADQKIEELAFKESIAREQFRDAQDALVHAEDRHTTEIYAEQESRRVREAELGLVLKQYHAVGAMCHDMREEGRKLKDMLEELRRRYVASEEWGTALAKRVAETETELAEARSSRAFRLAQRIKKFFNKTPSRDIALKKSKRRV